MSRLIYHANVILCTFWSVSSSSKTGCKIERNVVMQPNLTYLQSKFQQQNSANFILKLACWSLKEGRFRQRFH